MMHHSNQSRKIYVELQRYATRSKGLGYMLLQEHNYQWKMVGCGGPRQQHGNKIFYGRIRTVSSHLGSK